MAVLMNDSGDLMPGEATQTLWVRVKNTFSQINLPLVMLTLLGALLRLYHLGYKTLWFDEAVTFWISKGSSLSEILQLNAEQNSAPVLFTLLTSFILDLGETEFILRLIPWFAGVVSIPAIYFLARQFVSEYPALICAILVALAPTQVRYSQELREYSLTFLLATLILLFFAMYLQKNQVKHLVFMTGCMVLGMFTQYGLGVLIVAINVCFIVDWLIDENRSAKDIPRWGVAQLVVLGAAIVVYYTSLSYHLTPGWGADSSANYLSTSYWSGEFSSLLHFVWANSLDLFGFTFPKPVFLQLTMLGLIVSLVDRRHKIALFMFIVPVLLTVILSMVQYYPYGGIRQDIFLTPMIYILAGLGANFLLKLDQSRLVVTLLLFFLVVNGIYLSWHVVNQSSVENLRPIVAKLHKSYKPGDKIYVYYAAYPAFSYYYRDDAEAWVIGTRNREETANYYTEVDAVLASNNPVWMVFSHCFAEECELIPEYVSDRHQIQLKAHDVDAYLYYVP